MEHVNRCPCPSTKTMCKVFLSRRNVLQHHMPGLCAFSRGEQMQKKKKKKKKNSPRTKPRSDSFDLCFFFPFFFFLEKSVLRNGERRLPRIPCAHMLPRTCAQNTQAVHSYRLVGKKKKKLHSETSSPKFLPWISRCDIAFFFFFLFFPIYIINVSTHTLSPHIIMKTISNFTSYK